MESVDCDLSADQTNIAVFGGVSVGGGGCH